MFSGVRNLFNFSHRNINISLLRFIFKHNRLIHINRYLPAEQGSQGEYYTFTGPVPQDRLTIRFARSSGPGGQNVNKVNTKVEIRFHVDSADWIPQEARAKLHVRERNRINKNGELVVTSTKFRSQQRNVEDGIARIQNMIKEASLVPPLPSQEQQEHVKKLSRRFNERRLAEKKFSSLKKQGRRNDD